MRFKNLAISLLASLAISGVSASAAEANWEIEGVPLFSGLSETVQYGSSENFTLTSKVLGTEIVLTATGLECGFGSTCKIDQAGTVEHSSGALTFTGVTVDKPAGCSVPSDLTTNALTDELIMDPGGGFATFDKFFPEVGETLMTINVSFCAAAGFYPLKGTIVGRTSTTGFGLVWQELKFNASEQATGGGSLKLGSEKATLTGRATVRLSGANAGKPWGGS